MYQSDVQTQSTVESDEKPGIHLLFTRWIRIIMLHFEQKYGSYVYTMILTP